MSRRLTPTAILLAFSALGAAHPPSSPRPSPLIVHEWGTFTSVAGQDGRAVEWLPLNGPSDLPCFVDRFRFNVKGSLPGTVRMETPVLYFYAPSDITVNVDVQFRQGAVTEWFPRAAVSPTNVDEPSFRRPDFSSRIAWTNVNVTPGAKVDLPIDGSGSHYYTARQTDASPLRLASQSEKFLFYRGVGRFEPPISATVTGEGTIVVRNPGGEALGDIILFENHGGTMSYRVRHRVGSQLTLDVPSLDGEFVRPEAELEQILIEHGLYPKEARAMVDTWRDSWFEEGTRLFYIASRSVVDSVLPLEIRPVPAEVARVFVGRVELVTSTATREVGDAIDRSDRLTLRKYGRFLQPIADRVVASRTSAARARIQSLLQSVAVSGSSSPAVCK